MSRRISALVQQLLAESLSLGALGGSLGIVLANWGIGVFIFFAKALITAIIGNSNRRGCALVYASAVSPGRSVLRLAAGSRHIKGRPE
jgi:hypothetical protein